MQFVTLRQLESGEAIRLAAYATREEAEEHVKSFTELWPGVYLVQEIGEQDDDVNP